MSFSTTFSESKSFTLTHAKHISSKVATDLKRIQRLYGSPSDYEIARYENELIEFLKSGYLGTVTYGFQKDNKWREPTLKYTAKDLSSLLTATDDDPGRIKPNADILGAHFTSYLTYSSSWSNVSQSDKDSFHRSLPFHRVGADEPGLNGYLSQDKTYSSGGKALDRATLINTYGS